MNELLQSYTLDRTRIAVAALGDDSDERAYWAKQPPLERLRALEFLRQVCYGYDPATTRLQRLLTVAQLGDR